MLTIWGRNNSSNVQKVMWLVGELGLQHERHDVGGAFGKTKEPAYLAKNPNALVPVIEDDGFVLWESNAILRYLATKHGSFIATEPKARALTDQWHDWQATLVMPALSPAFWGLIRTPPEKRNPEAIAESQKKTTAAMLTLEAELGTRPFVVGDSFTIADIPLGIVAYRFWALVPDRPPLPNVERWYAALAERPAFRAHVSSIPIT